MKPNFNANRLYQIIVAPHVSEKSTRLGDAEKKQITFKVLKDATKPEIKAAVEAVFNVKVDSVQIINNKPKLKWFKRVPGKRSAWKKAYVSLAKGQDIDFVGSKVATNSKTAE